jgi:hypothetical protein
MMMSRIRINLELEMRRRARQRASDMGISLTEYVKRLIARDLGGMQPAANASLVFDLGSSAGSDIAKNKDTMIAEAFAAG